MKKILASLGVSLFVFSMNINANEGSPSLQQISKACALKQVTHSCTLPGKQAKSGVCVDAKGYYGVICDVKQTPKS